MTDLLMCTAVAATTTVCIFYSLAQGIRWAQRVLVAPFRQIVCFAIGVAHGYATCAVFDFCARVALMLTGVGNG